MVQKYTPTVRFWAGPYLIIFVSDPCDLEILMNSEKCLGREICKNIVDRYPLGDGLIAIGGEQWKIHRKFILSSFHYRHFEYFVKENAVDIYHYITDAIDIYHYITDAIDIYHYITKFAFDSICETVLGLEMKVSEKISEKYINSTDTATGILTQMFLKPWLLIPIVIRLTSYHKKMIECTNYLNSFSNELFIKRTKEYRERINQQVSTRVDSDNSAKKNRPSLIDSII
uniref:Cytochrome P450 n=1 Tax=Timema genevievae TaxID=629358 RepID=A0A7R9K2N0_TIMGE|nr:unnamed protein product [Timema genevievae]